MSTAQSAVLEIDNDKFKTIMKVSDADSIEQRKDRSEDDDESSKTLQLLRIKGSPRLLPEGSIYSRLYKIIPDNYFNNYVSIIRYW